MNFYWKINNFDGENKKIMDFINLSNFLNLKNSKYVSKVKQKLLIWRLIFCYIIQTNNMQFSVQYIFDMLNELWVSIYI